MRRFRPNRITVWAAACVAAVLSYAPIAAAQDNSVFASSSLSQETVDALDGQAGELATLALENIREGELGEARMYLDQALALVSDNSDLWRLSAQLDLLRGQTQSAEQQADRAVAEDEDDFISRMLRAIARLARRPDQDERIDRDLAGFRAYPLVDRALQLMDEGRYDEAREFLDRAIEVDPDNVVVWTLSGDLEMRRGNMETAREHLDRAVAIDPNYARGRLYRGLVLIQFGEYAASREELSRALLIGDLTQDEATVARDTLLSIGGTPPQVQTANVSDIDNGRVLTADDIREEAAEAAASGNGLLAYNLMASLENPSIEDRMRRSDYALSAGELAAAMADLRSIREDESATNDQRRTAATRAASIHHANGRFADARDELLFADEIAPLSLDELRFLVRLTREAGPVAQHMAALGRLQTGGMGEERAWAGEELADLQRSNGDTDAAAATLTLVAQDTNVSAQARANALTQLGEMAEADGNTDAANDFYAQAAALTANPPRVADIEVDVATPTQATAEPDTRSDDIAVVSEPVEPTRPAVTDQPSDPTPTRVVPSRTRAPSTADRAFSYAQSGRCDDAIPLFREAYRASGEVSLLIAKADCENNIGDTDAAITSLQQASNDPGLSHDQEVYVWRSLGFLYEADQDWMAAEGAWRRADAVAPSAEHKYAIGRTLNAQGRLEDALAVWATMDANELTPAQRADYQAIVGNSLLTRAYAAQAAGRDREAAALFEEAIAQDPGGAYGATEDLAYTYMRMGDHDAAARTFRRVVDNRALYPQATEEERAALDARMYRVRQEITQLERSWYAYGAVTYREGQNRGGPNFAQGNSGQSQAAFEAGWFPEDYGYNVGSGVAVYGRVFGSFEDNSLNFLEETLQGGVGIHYKPFETHGLILTAERLIKIGDLSRNAWLLAAAYSWGQGGSWQPGEDHWAYTSAYGEVAYIPDSPDFFSTSGDVIHGVAIPIAERTAIIPHGVLAARYSEDDFQRTSYLEAGPGIMVRHWFGQDHYHAPRGTVDLQLQYRFMLADGSNPDITDNGSFIARLVFSY